MRSTLVWVALLLSVSGWASAQEAVPVVLSYASAEGCPSHASFVARLRMHTHKLRLSDDEEALHLAVNFTKTRSGYVGRLDVTRRSEALGSRQFEDADCTEVAWALALSAALSIDPEASLNVASEPSDAATSTGTSESTPDTSQTGEAASEPSKNPEQPAERSAAAAVPNPIESSEEPSAPQTEAAIRWALGPEALVSVAFDPQLSVGGGLLVGVRSTETRAVLPLELALRVDFLTTRLSQSEPIVLDWWSAELVGCPVRVGTRTTLLLCALFQAGLLQAEGVQVEAPRSAQRSFLTAGFGLWLRQRLAEHWELTGAINLEIPLVNRAFAVDPDAEVVSSSRALGADVALGVLHVF